MKHPLIYRQIEEIKRALIHSKHTLIVDYYGGYYSIDSGASYSVLTYENLTYDLAQV